MQIKNIPFIYYGFGIYRPWLKVRIINPRTLEFLTSYAIVDTGADCCMFPSVIGKQIGHNDEKVTSEKASGFGGSKETYYHTNIIEIYHPTETEGDLLYKTDEIMTGFTETLPAFLLGTHGFLENFILYVDYPAKTFSLKTP